MTNREDLIEVASERQGEILAYYAMFADKKPVMLLEMPAEKIYAYPYLEFKETLSARSQQMLESQYEEALANKQIVVFVKDNDRKKMISFSVDEG